MVKVMGKVGASNTVIKVFWNLNQTEQYDMRKPIIEKISTYWQTQRL